VLQSRRDGHLKNLWNQIEPPEPPALKKKVVSIDTLKGDERQYVCCSCSWLQCGGVVVVRVVASALRGGAAANCRCEPRPTDVWWEREMCGMNAAVVAAPLVVRCVLIAIGAVACVRACVRVFVDVRSHEMKRQEVRSPFRRLRASPSLDRRCAAALYPSSSFTHCYMHVRVCVQRIRTVKSTLDNRLHPAIDRKVAAIVAPKPKNRGAARRSSAGSRGSEGTSRVAPVSSCGPPCVLLPCACTCWCSRPLQRVTILCSSVWCSSSVSLSLSLSLALSRSRSRCRCWCRRLCVSASLLQ
jgi:hypothetical protein